MINIKRFIYPLPQVLSLKFLIKVNNKVKTASDNMQCIDTKISVGKIPTQIFYNIVVDDDEDDGDDGAGLKCVNYSFKRRTQTVFVVGNV